MTLSQTAILTKQVITLSIIGLILATISFIGYKIWYAHYLSTLPPVEEKPDTKFGVLPWPDFPKALVSTSNFSYTLDTTTGSLPKLGSEGFEKLVKVYFIIKPLASLLSPEKAETLANKFDITTPPQILSEVSYRFSEKEKTLNLDLDSGNFTYVKEASSAAITSLDDDNRLISDFENFLSSLGVFKDELKAGRTKVNLLKIQGDKFIPTNLRTEATAAELSLWPKALNKKAIFTANFNKSLINAVVFNSASNLENYLSINFTFWTIDQTILATYPTKLPDDAFADLKAGRGVVIIEPSKPQISITSIYLGYYLSGNYNQYLEPIYIFEGPQFVAYVPAVVSNFTEGPR